MDEPNSNAAATEASPTGAPCPICQVPAIRKFRPFCSARCAEIDLGRWMTGRYAIPVNDSDDDEDGDAAKAGEMSQHISGLANSEE
ncbi:MAG: DNA gyrase inhibitor YacG [Pseudomonadota bacterium]